MRTVVKPTTRSGSPCPHLTQSSTCSTQRCPTHFPTFYPTAHPATAPSPAPTHHPTVVPSAVPTPSPTPHPCDDGTHGCDQEAGGICYKGSGNVWMCDCKQGYHCVSGCENSNYGLIALPTHVNVIGWQYDTIRQHTGCTRHCDTSQLSSQPCCKQLLLQCCFDPSFDCEQFHELSLLHYSRRLNLCTNHEQAVVRSSSSFAKLQSPEYRA